jgi:hypothetical protein
MSQGNQPVVNKVRLSLYAALRNAILIAFVAASVSLLAQEQPPKPPLFDRTEVMIPMRDGVKLQTAIFVPKSAKAPLPFLIVRTPYGVPENENPLTDGHLDELIADGYIFVYQNLRGRFKSEGTFVMQRPPRDKSKPNSIDEGTDAYDTIDWLIKNVPNNNGRAGMYGVSYSGWTTVQALMEPHPALKAASEQASPADMFMGDDFHHNGAFRLSYGYEYATMVEAEKQANKHPDFDYYDTYEWYLRLGALSNINAKYAHGTLPTWNDFVKHPNRDQFWKAQAVETYLHQTRVPNLNVAGWWDQEDAYGPVDVYHALEQNDPDHLNYLVAGPWNHGGWGHGPGNKLGPIGFESDTSKDFRAKIQSPWFAYWLHDKGKLDQPEAKVFETGSDVWKSFEKWPPERGITKKKLYFQAGGKLSFNAPTTALAAFDSYISDPANPVPYRERPVTPTYPGPEWPVWLVQDQRFVDNRPDVLTWETDPLTEDVEMAGDVMADLFASTSGTDSDWIVKLIDVYPEDYQPKENEKKGPVLRGYQLMIASEVFRGRYRTSFEHPEPITAGKVLEYKFSLREHDHMFKKDHRIMVQVQSTWFPLIDRNPQKYVPNIFMAKDADYTKATQRIFRTKANASGVILPVVTGQ